VTLDTKLLCPLRLVGAGIAGAGIGSSSKLIKLPSSLFKPVAPKDPPAGPGPICPASWPCKSRMLANLAAAMALEVVLANSKLPRQAIHAAGFKKCLFVLPKQSGSSDHWYITHYIDYNLYANNRYVLTVV
jgi:hypothetical protein